MSRTLQGAGWLVPCAALLALLVAPACDNTAELSQGERRIVVGAAVSSICPLTDGDSTVNVQATVYGLDGSVAPDVKVTMTTTDGVFPNGTQTEVVKTGPAGIANIALTTRRPPDDKIVVTGTLADGKQDSVEIAAPPTVPISLSTSASTATVGDRVTIILPASGLCHARRLLLELSYNPSVVSFLATGEGGLFNDADAGGAATPTDMYAVVGPPGTLRVNYGRTDRPPTGVTTSGTLIGVLFEAIGPGQAQIYIRSVTLLPVDGRPLGTDNSTDSPDSLPITIQAASTVAAR